MTSNPSQIPFAILPLTPRVGRRAENTEYDTPTHSVVPEKSNLPGREHGRVTVPVEAPSADWEVELDAASLLAESVAGAVGSGVEAVRRARREAMVNERFSARL